MQVSMASQIHLQPYPQPPHNPFVVGDAAPYGAQQGSYPPPAASSSGQPSFDPYGARCKLRDAGCMSIVSGQEDHMLPWHLTWTAC